MDILKEIIYPAIDEFKEVTPEASNLIKDPNCNLLGENAVLDSLSLVNFIVIIEQYILKHKNISIELTSPSALGRKNSPFKTIQTLIDFIDELLKSQNRQ